MMTDAAMREMGEWIMMRFGALDASPDDGKTILVNVLAATIAMSVDDVDDIAEQVEAVSIFLHDATRKAFKRKT